jgi:predicted nucleic acid binding AN1-type Zn finger protein
MRIHGKINFFISIQIFAMDAKKQLSDDLKNIEKTTNREKIPKYRSGSCAYLIVFVIIGA